MANRIADEVLEEVSSDEELPGDSGCDSDLSEHPEIRVVSIAELRTLNRTKHCMIQFYYSTGGALAVCASCMIELSDIELDSMDAVQMHETNFLEQLDGRICSKCRQPMFVTHLAECFAWLQRCDACLAQLEEYCVAKRPRLTVGSRQSVVARIARLAGAKLQLERRFVHVGGEYASTSAGSKKSLVWREINAAFKNRIRTGAVINTDYIEPWHFLEDASDMVIEQVRDAIAKHVSVKVNTVFIGEFVNIHGDRDNKSIATKNHELYRASNLREWYEQCVIQALLAMLDEFQERDSGWALSRIQNLTVNINKFNPMHAGCWIELPQEVKNKRAVINVRSKDNACFAWSVVAALHPAENHADRESSYPHYSTVLKFDDIQFPMKVKDIGKFERLNDVSVNVYSTEFDKKEKRLYFVPIRLTADKKEKHVNLYYVEDKHDVSLGHFVWITNLSRLVSSQLSKNEHRKFICDRCLHYFHLEEKLLSHEVECGKVNNCAILLPGEDDKYLEFDNYINKEYVPFVLYSDLECVLRKMENETENVSRFSITIIYALSASRGI
ncbi:uncharacterized protein LOC120359475 [Solenopsis invicta]|uniref:uncharacterized protein LOC120359475 n=1 Tax=Solenopsis invicta TaxID=13686 RepID=UPI00193DF238|nr:uncharacterized protein LOC120359475 [Solenopsis invicta]